MQLLSAVGNGCPDLLVGTPAPRRMLLLLEVKNPKQAKSAQQLRPAQVEWHQRWALYPLATVRSFDEARDIVLEYCGRAQTRVEGVPSLGEQLAKASAVDANGD